MSLFAARKEAAPGAPAPQSGAAVRLFAVLCAFLLAMLLTEHAGRMERVGFTTHDDLVSDLFAAEAKAGGFGAAWHEAGVIARGQGRVSYYVSYLLNIAPYLLEDDTARALLITGVHFLSLAALCAFLGLYVGAGVAALTLAAMYALLPHWWRYFPIGAYPIQFHAAVLLFFAAAIMQVLSIRLKVSTAAAWRMRIASLPLLYCSMSVYEASTVLFAAIMGIALVCEWREAGPQRRGRVLAAAISVLGVLVAYAMLFVAFRLMHPSTYEGNQISPASLLNLRAVAAAMAIYAAGGLPLAHLYFQAGTVSRFSPDSLAELGAVRFLIRGVTLAGVVEGALFAAAVFCFVRWVGIPAGRRRRTITAGFAALVLALLVTAPIAVTARYQQNPPDKTPHVPGYFSYLCFMSAMACAFGAAATVFPYVRRRAAAAILLPAGAALFLAVAATQETNDAIVRSQEAHSSTWRLAGLFIRSEIFEGLPEDAVIVAPALWDEIDPAWPHYEPYWQNYFAAHSGRRVRVVRRFSDVPAGSRYYLEIQPARDQGRPVLLFQQLGERTLVEWTLVLATQDIKDAVLSYVATEDGAAGPADSPAGRLETPALPACAYRRGAYVTRIPSPRLIAGTATVESARLAGARKREGLTAPR